MEREENDSTNFEFNYLGITVLVIKLSYSET